MKKTIIIAVLGVFASLSACKKNLDFADFNRLPQREFWKTADDALAALTSCYGVFSSDWAFYDPSSLGPMQMASDETSKGSTANSQADLNAFIDFSFTPSLARFNNLWTSRYSAINLCNQLITYVPAIDMAEVDKKQILGEARFIRAWLYFDLAKIFGEVVIYDGLPPNAAYDIPKSSLEDVYAFILSDLEYGYQNMRRTPWDVRWKGRVTAWAARSLQAKVLMYMASGDKFAPGGTAIGGKTWDDVKAVTNDVINNGIYSLYTARGDSSFYYLFRLENENNDESIFESQNGVSTTVGGINSSAYAYNTWVKSGSDGGFGYSVPSDKLVADWSARATAQNDKRFWSSVIYRGQAFPDRTICDGASALDGITGIPRYNFKVYIPKAQRSAIRGNGYLTQIEQNQRMFRFADVLLIDAEAKFRTGDIPGALVSLNRVRSRAAEPDLTASTISLQAIWDERRFELAFEMDRYFDLIRTGQAATVLAYKNWAFPKNVFYPIPQAQIDLSNGKLIQNQNW